MATAWKQWGFRFRNDDGGESAATWLANNDTNVTIDASAGDVKKRLRVVTQETGTTKGRATAYLYVSKNGGAYSLITASSTNGCKVADSTYLTDDEATTGQIVFTRFVAGKVDDDDGMCSYTSFISQNYYTESEFCFLIDSANVVDGDYFDFKVYDTTTPYTTYDSIPRLTISKSVASHKNLLLLGAG